MEEKDCKYFWHFTPHSNFGLAFSLEIYFPSGSDDCNGSVFLIDEGLANARWNLRFAHGTDELPLLWDPKNEFGSKPYAADSFRGGIALVRRGGGLGFAQKVLALQDAGALGCIVYECEGDRESMGSVFTMGQHFGGIDYPEPKIPSLLVGAAHTNRLLESARKVGLGAENSSGSCTCSRACIKLERSDAALRRTPVSFDAFRHCLAEGESIHMAVVVERIVLPEGLRETYLTWFEEPFGESAVQYGRGDANTSWFTMGTILLQLGPENAPDMLPLHV